MSLCPIHNLLDPCFECKRPADKHDANDIERECMEEAAALVMCGAVRQGAARQVAQSMRGLIEQFAVARSAVSSTPPNEEIEAFPKRLEEQVHFMTRQAQMLAEEGNDVSADVMNKACGFLHALWHEVEQERRFKYKANLRADAAEARVSATPRSIPAIGLFKEIGKQRDECADALRALAKVVEDNFPMPAGVHAGSPLDRARKALANVPTYEQRLRNIAEGIGMTYEELMAAMKNRSDDRAVTPCSCGARAGQYHATGCGHQGVFNG